MAGNVVHVNFAAPEDEISYSSQELADRLGCSKRHVEQLTSEGIPSVIRGRRRLYKLGAAIEWAEKAGRTKGLKRLDKARSEVARNHRGRIDGLAPPDPPPVPPISA